MATLLEDHQFEILRDGADEGVAFGLGRDIHVDAGGFDPGTADWLVQDQEDPFSGATRFGRDVRTGPTWAWSMHTNQTDEVSALSVLDDLADAWSPDDLKNGEPMIIRYAVGGRTRRVYGRPRRFASPPDNKILSGMIPVTADFKLTYPGYYDDNLTQITVGLEYSSPGGILFPVTFPVATKPGGYTTGNAYVEGKRPTWPIIRFNGPIVDPDLLGPTWRLALTANIGEGHYIEIDTRPWKRTVMVDGTSFVPGALNPKTRLRDLYLNPGAAAFGLRGTSGTGTGNAIIKWHPAYSSF